MTNARDGIPVQEKGSAHLVVREADDN